WEGLEPLNRVVVIGDTGCNNDKGTSQDCRDLQAWPFSRVAVAAAGLVDGSPGPDLVIHVGDYRYRTNTSGNISDTWENWYKDFFKPAEPLLLAAPWVMIRGNHENCFGKNG